MLLIMNFGFCFYNSEEGRKHFELMLAKYGLFHPKATLMFDRARLEFDYGNDPWVGLRFNDSDGKFITAEWNPSHYLSGSHIQIDPELDDYEEMIALIDKFICGKRPPRRIPTNPIRCAPLPLP